MDLNKQKQERLREKLKDFDIETLWLAQTGSTNEASSALALEGKENLVVADMQTNGLGRMGRSFSSGTGGLYESLAVCIDDCFPQGEQPDLNRTLHFPLLVALGVMRAVQTVCAGFFDTDIIPDIKWPNDLQIKGKKICGILCKAAQNRGKWFLVAGIGVNVANELPEELDSAASLKTLLKDRAADADWEAFKEDLAAEIFKEVSRVLKKGITGSQELLDEVEAHCITIGKQVSVPERNVTGRAVQIGDDGSLCIQTEQGEYEIVKSGDVTIFRN